jgi:hypothetical protein
MIAAVLDASSNGDVFSDFHFTHVVDDDRRRDRAKFRAPRAGLA